MNQVDEDLSILQVNSFIEFRRKTPPKEVKDKIDDILTKKFTSETCFLVFKKKIIIFNPLANSTEAIEKLDDCMSHLKRSPMTSTLYQYEKERLQYLYMKTQLFELDRFKNIKSSIPAIPSLPDGLNDL